MENKNHCLIIVGTPRSGHSILAGCLKLLGADLGKNIIFNDSHGGKDHFENTDLTLAHNILLRDLGCSWDMIGGLPHEWQTSKAADNAKQKIRSILENNFTSNRLWVVKDPRICKFLPLWLSLLKEMNVKPVLIFNLRHPQENARSLVSKDNLDIRKAFLLWLSYYREAFGESCGTPNAIITFDQLLADPVFTLKRISDTLAIEYPYSLENTHMDILNFVRPELKHHHNGPSASNEEAQYDHFNSLYEQIRLLCVERTKQLDSDNHNTEFILEQNQDMLPAVLNYFSSEKNLPEIMESQREKASLVSGQLFNDILSLVGDQERKQNSLRIKREQILLDSSNPGTTLFTQVYFPQNQEKTFIEEKSEKILLAPDEWQEIVISLPDPLLVRSKGLRLKPLNMRGIVHISGIRLVNQANGDDVLNIKTSEQFKLLNIQGDAFTLPGKDVLSVFVYNYDPQINISPNSDLPDCPLEIRIWVKPQTNQKEIKIIWNRYQDSIIELKNTRAKIQNELTTSREKIESGNKAKKDLELKIESEKKAKKDLESKIESEKKAKKDLESRLEEFEAELSSVREELSSTQSKLLNKQEQIHQINRKNSELLTRQQDYLEIISKTKRWMGQLQNDLDSLLNSKRWQIGNNLVRLFEIILLRKKQPMAVDHMQQIFDNLNINGSQKQNPPSNRQTIKPTKGKFKFQTPLTDDGLMRQLENDIRQFSASTRWKVGNAIVGLINKMLLRKKQPMPLDHMQDIIKEYKNIKSTLQNISPELTQRWKRNLESDLNALLASKRWQLGNGLVRLVEIILLRKKQPMAIDHMQALFEQFSQDQNIYYNYKDNNSDQESSIILNQPPLDQGGKDLMKENEFLLLQLHQVQEDLEKYCLKYQDLKQKIEVD